MKLDRSEQQFQPNLTPRQMLEGGIFGGSYFNPDSFYKDSGIYEFPVDCWEEVNPDLHSRFTPLHSLNRYGVKAGESIAWWRDKNLIADQDPRGWVQWYFRYYYGRRSSDDTRQINRWIGFYTRHVPMALYSIARQLKKLDRSIQPSDYDDARLSPGHRQAVFQWGYELTYTDFLNHPRYLIQ